VSTYLHLVCLDHTPPLVAEDESGQHLYDLPQIRADLAADLLTLANESENAERSAPFAHDPWYFRRNTIRFRVAHRACRIGIRDEYGVDHATTTEATR
jgi:hypothetical protein